MIRYNIHQDILNNTHILIAGTTGSGKSVLLNGLIRDLLFTTPNENKLVLFDLKRTELGLYKNLPHTLSYIDSLDRCEKALNRVLSIIDNRCKEMQQKVLKSYEGATIWVIFDELADLFTRNKKIIPLIQTIGQTGRAARVIMIGCTQTVKADVLPTKITCNFNAIVGLRTRTAQQSRLIIQQKGLESLPIYGKGLYITPNYRDAQLIDVPFITDNEIKEVINYHKSTPITRFIKRLYHI